ncbi:2Fe-2S iron-sulfur cluster-binding protein [Vibrio agarivorans]|uniref:2Fe-2S iron-sulfur cluster-binding protein n=1 Tax=Vibrio agarivorans TaxID=153622 RepID=A0ABT7Y2U1_9VIBR|nr:2Fe-2S iron-sulfur cluster-binding protein [Vibrio agarivorans]MDN2482362.1 2Fe-2S iron-sulfur cluster-binding protein [Vibrio agarivorans]
MSFTVTITPENITFDVESEQTILEGALNNNIRFPNRCQVGACAACLCKLISGEVTYHLDPMLTESEKAQGWVFACQAKVESNLIISLSD